MSHDERKGTREIIEKINRRLEGSGKSRVTFANELNNFLPKRMRRKVDKSRMVSIYRWLSLDGQSWVCPSSEVTLAMQAWLRS